MSDWPDAVLFDFDGVLVHSEPLHYVAFQTIADREGLTLGEERYYTELLGYDDYGALRRLLELNDRVCKWPIGHPGEPDFHFCGDPINPGFPYCLDHCSIAYQAQLPRRDRRPPPPLPFGGPRVR